MPRKSGQQPTRPTLLKRKRTVSEDEELGQESDCLTKRSKCQPEGDNMAEVSVPEGSDSYAEVDSDLLQLFDLDTENNPPPQQESAASCEADESWMMSNETVDLCSTENEPTSENMPSESGSDEGFVTPSYHPSWSQFRLLSYILTPATDRLSPLPVLNFANPQYVWEIVCAKDELSTHERDEDMFNKHPSLQPRMRAILLDWLIEVCEVYKMHRETYHLTMDFIDRYLSRKRDIPKQRLQLIGITCLFIAAKIEEIYPPKIGEFAFVTDGACADNEILELELVVLKTLNWNLQPVTVNKWLNLYMQLLSTSPNKAREAGRPVQLNHSFELPQYSGLTFVHAAQLVDLAMLDEGSLRYPYSVIATSSLYHTCSRELALYVSGLQWGNIKDCVEWMSPFARVVKEDGQNMVTGNSVRQVAASGESAPHIVVDDSHNIQTHLVDLQMLDKAKSRFEDIPECAEEEIASSPAGPSGLLTPPSSSGKRISDRKTSLTGSLT